MIYKAGLSNPALPHNIGIGSGALQNNTTTHNIAIGDSALYVIPQAVLLL